LMARAKRMTTRKMTPRTRKTRDGEIYERARGPE
jgi:hypothetical protein